MSIDHIPYGEPAMTATLIYLNALRDTAGMKPLKSWKESNAKLAAAITKLETQIGTHLPPVIDQHLDIKTPLQIAADEPVTVEVAKSFSTDPVANKIPKKVVAAAEQFAADVVAKVPAKKAVKKLEKALDKAKDVITLVEIAKELEFNPKVARAKMRRVTVPKGYTVDGAAHTFHAKHRQWVIDALQRDNRKK
jgi:hypothetical protein